ncbi:hypothetical protein C8Q70DRAFT_937459 [Cubamyces menziesii]|nr:hypothetical protein C8Q70DRAFT_937459 [Cubamyces menziesii]
MGHQDKLYADKRWQKFPQAEKHYQELDIYPAFIKRRMHSEGARGVAGVRDDQVREAAWVDYHSRAPQHLEEGATKIRPDCALAMAFAENVLNKSFCTEGSAIRSGLFLSGTQVSVWLQDRSGLLGMDVPIDIHEWVISTDCGTFITLRAVSLLRADMVTGSGCMVWAAIRYEDRAKDPDTRKVFVLKQWWRSEGQVDEGAIYEDLQSVAKRRTTQVHRRREDDLAFVAGNRAEEPRATGLPTSTVSFIGTSAREPAHCEDWEERVTDEVVHRAVHLVKRRYPTESSPSQITQLATQYIQAALEYHKLSNRAPPSGNVYTPESLVGMPLLFVVVSLRFVTGWKFILTCDPASSSSTKIRHTTGRRAQDTQTPANGCCPLARFLPFPTSSVVHDAIHDMESFFWVLLFFCITRGGPGGGRRKELEGELDTVPAQVRDEVQQIRRINHCLFGGDMETIACNKAELFLHPEDFEEHILPYVHPYFEPLKLMLRRWWDLLVLAYAFEGYEYHNIHALVIEILDEAASALASQAGVDSQEAMDKRKNYLRNTTHAIAASHDQSTTPPSSPLSDILDITTPESKKTPAWKLAAIGLQIVYAYNSLVDLGDIGDDVQSAS